MSAEAPQLPPPVHHDTISDGYRTFIAVASVFTALSLVSVVLRFVQRRMIRQIAWDDWAIVGSLLFAIGVMITTVLVATEGGAGYHIYTFEIPQLEEYIKICLANNVMYNVSLMFSKLSVLFFYGRIFSIDAKTQLFMKCVGFVVIANCAAAAGGLIFSNSPVEGQWNLSIPSTTIETKAFWFSIGVINLVLDVIILLIPQVKVWKLQLSLQRRIAVCLVFMLGGFVCVTTTVRLVMMYNIDVSDITYAFTVAGIWTCVEMNVSIICACLPIMYGLLKTTKRNLTTAATKGSTISYSKTNDDYVKLETGTGTTRSHSYQIKRTSAETGSEDMVPLGPIRVERTYMVSKARVGDE